MNYIHQTAIVEPTAEIGYGNHIGPYCYIGPRVVLGDCNRLESFVSIGTPPEHRDHFKSHGLVKIGNHNVFREFVTINSGIIETVVHNESFFLKGSHVGHDSIIYNGVTLSCGVKIGGHSIVFQGANFGLNSCCHQFSRIPHYAMIGMGAVVTRKTMMETFGKYAGVPAKKIGINVRQLCGDNATYEAQEKMRHEYINSL